MPRKKKPAPATSLPETVEIMQVPPSVRREVAARCVLGISPNTFDAARKREDFPKPFVLGPQCLVWSTSELLAWRDRQRGIENPPPLNPGANSKESQHKMAERARRLHAAAYRRKGPASKREAA